MEAHMSEARTGMRGSALAVAVIFVAVLLATTAALFTLTFTRNKVSSERSSIERRNRAVDSALSVKINQLCRFREESIVGTFPDGTKYAVLVRPHLTLETFKLTAAVLARDSKDPTWVEAVVERNVLAGASAFDAAIIAKQIIQISGGAIVDGNCFNLNEIRVGLGYCPSSHFSSTTGFCNNATCSAAGNSANHPFPHKASKKSIHDQLGIATAATPTGVVIAGASRVGGCGDTRDPFGTPAGNGDGSGAANYCGEADRGIDGNMEVVDRRQNIQWGRDFGQSATRHFPTTPDEVLDSPAGLTKTRAQERGTYFTTEASWDTWRTTRPGGRAPPNSLIYLDFKATSVNLGDNLDWGKTYHVLIQHKPKIPEVNVPRGGIAGATVTAYTNFSLLADQVAVVGATTFVLDARALTSECTDSSHGLYTGALVAAVSHPSFSGNTTHAAGPNGHAAGAPKYDGFGYRKTEPDGDSVAAGFQAKFFGVMIIDDMGNMNSSSLIFGGLACLQGDNGSAHSLINGGGKVRYSAAAIDRAIAQNLQTGVEYKVKAYRDRVKSRDARDALKLIGAPISTAVIPDDPSPVTSYPTNKGVEDRPDTLSSTVDGWFEGLDSQPIPAGANATVTATSI
jgi:hypothetical protein